MSITKKLFVGALVAAFGLTISTAGAAYMHTVTLKQGSTGSQVMMLQQTLNMTTCKVAVSGAGAPGYETSAFGPKTKAAVMCFQAANGLTADGIVGPMTGAKLALVVGGGTPSTPAPCPVGYVCTPTGGNTGSTGSLSGGAGTLDFSETQTDVEDTVAENHSENVLGFKAEADGSDIAVTNVKVSLANVGTGSERLTDYVESVSIFMGDEEVGSVDASDFSRDSGSPDIFSKTISLSNAVINDGDEETFYVVVEGASSIDSDDQTNSDWVVGLNTVRYTDATGAILSENFGDNDDVADAASADDAYEALFNFEDSSAQDDISIKSSSSNPSSSTLQVEADATSDEFLVGVFKLDVDEDSSDISIFDLPVVLTLDDSDDTTGTTADGIVDNVRVKVDGDWYDADLDDDNVSDGDGTVSYIADIDGDVTINAGDDVTVEVYVTFNEQDGNYGTGTTVVAAVTGSDIGAEGEDDDVDVDGSFTGKTHTLSVDAPVFDLTSKSLKLSQAIDGVSTGEEDIFVAEFTFDVTAADEDIFLPLDTFSFGTAGTQGVEYTVNGGATVSSAVLSVEDTDAEEDNSVRVSANDTETFTFRVYLRGNDAANSVQITSFWYEESDATPNGTPEVTSGISDFKTGTVFLAK